jgi:hypothetical protein
MSNIHDKAVKKIAARGGVDNPLGRRCAPLQKAGDLKQRCASREAP